MYQIYFIFYFFQNWIKHLQVLFYDLYRIDFKQNQQQTHKHLI